MLRTTLTAVALVLAGAGIATAEDVVKVVSMGDKDILTDAADMTLYTFDKDAGGMSNCYDKCAENWPPLLADADMTLPEGFALTERKDGTMQVMYDDEPLYLWVKDTKPGDMTGDGVGGVWHTATD